MSISHFTELLADPQGTETWVRRCLTCLETDFREYALLTLAEWEGLGVTAPDLFPALAALERPAWGHWNGLLAGIRNARKSQFRNGTPGEREKIQQAAGLNARLDRLDEPCDVAVGRDLKLLGELARVQIAARPRFAAVFALPISLRNLVTHFAPTDPNWWRRAADALLPLIRYHAGRTATRPAAYPAPWFRVEDDEIWAFNGLRDDAVVYVSAHGQPRYAEEALRSVLLAFQRLLGKTDMQHENLRRLLHRLAPEQLKGVLLGDYLVGRPLGRGGYATVHAGIQLSTGRKVAVKILQDGLDEDARCRFQQEAVYLSQLNHPHIVRVLGSGEGTWVAPRSVSLDDEPWYREFSRSAPVKFFIVLEWLDGPTLEEVYQQGPEKRPGVTELTEWFAQVAGALSAVHGAGLLHRDVKPGNLMLTRDGVLKVMDFGIARSRDEVRTLVTTPGRVLGTPAYMSPEQLSASDPDTEVGPASDVYSLCATFYELFTGVRLFGHDTETAESIRTRKLVGDRPEPPRRHTRGLQWELDTILMGGLEPEPSHRYRSMRELEADLRNFLDHRPIAYKKPSSWRRLRLWYKRSPALAWTSTAAATLLSLLAATAVTFAVFQSEANATITRTNGDLQSSNTQLNEAKGGLEQANGDLRDTNSRLTETDRKRVAALRQAGGLALNQGLDLAREQGDVRTALLWFTHALELIPPEDAEMQYVVRANLAAWRRQLSPLQMRFPRVNAHVQPVALSPDGRTVLSGGAEEGIRPYDAVTGEPAGPALQHDESGPKDRDGRPGLKEQWITVVVFSPDGQLVLTGSRGRSTFELRDGKEVPPVGELRLWDARSFHVLTKRKFPGGVIQAAFRSDGAVVVTAGADNRARVWDVPSGKELGDGIPNLADFTPQFSPDGRRLLVRPDAKSARVYAAAEGKPLTPPIELGEDFVCATFAAGGGEVWTGGKERIRKWDAATGRELGTGVRTNGTIYAFAPGGWAILTGSDRGIWVQKTGDETPHRLSFPFRIATFSFTKDGRTLLLGGGNEARMESNSTLLQDGEVRLFDVATGELVGRPMPHTFPVRAAAISDDGRFVATGTGVSAVHVPLHLDENGNEIKPGSGGELRVWEIAAGNPPPRRRWALSEASSAFGQLILNPDRTQAIALQSGPSTGPDGAEGFTRRLDGTTERAQVFDAATGAPVGGALPFSDGWPAARADEDPQFGATVRCFWSTPDGRVVAACTTHGFDEKWKAGEFPRRGERQRKSRNVTVLWRWKDNKPEGRGRPLPAGAVAVAFSHDGRRCLVLAEQSVRWWDAEALRPVGAPLALPPLADPTRPVFSAGNRVAFLSPDDRTLLLGERREDIRFVQHFTPQAYLFDLEGGKPVGTPIPHPQGVSDAAFSPDGSLVLIGTDGDTARLWHTRTGAPASAALRHGSAVRSVAFSPDGRLVATEGEGKVEVWHLASGQTIGPAVSASGRVVFGPDSRVVRVLGAGERASFRTSRSADPGAAEWELPTPVGLPVPVLIQASQVLGEMELSAGGLLRRLEGEEWRARRLEMSRASAADPLLSEFVTRGPADGTWHAGLAARFEEFKDWTAALRHLDTALRTAPDDVAWLRRRGTVYMSLMRLDEAVADFSRCLTLRPQEAEAWAGRGRILASREQWQEAGRDLRKAVELRPDDSASGYRLGLVLLAGADEEGYRKLCLRMLEQCGSSHDLQQLDHAVYLAALRPGSTNRSRELVKLAARLVSLSQGRDWSLLETYGAALYRDGQWEKAVDQLNKAAKANSDSASQWSAYFLAMAHHQMGNAAMATEWFSKATKAEKEKIPSSWMEKVRCRSLHEEAEGLVRKGKVKGSELGREPN